MSKPSSVLVSKSIEPMLFEDMEIEIEFDVKVYYEPPDTSVGIMSGEYVSDDWDIGKITLHIYAPERISQKLTEEQLHNIISDEEFDSIQDDACREAEAKAYDMSKDCDDY
jgi:hypothetical protein